jgi:hypothetical protein
MDKAVGLSYLSEFLENGEKLPHHSFKRKRKSKKKAVMYRTHLLCCTR